MKIHVVLAFSLTTLVRGSLEPAGYKSPGTYPETRYLPPSSDIHHPDNRYVSSPLDFSSQNVDTFTNQLSRTLSVPFLSEPVPLSQYLPANRQTSDENDYQVGNERDKVLSRYNSPNGIQRFFNQALHSNGYLSSSEKPGYQRKESSTGSYDSLHDGSYLSSNEQTDHFPSTFLTLDNFPPEEQSLTVRSNYQDSQGHRTGSYNYPTDYGNQERHSGSGSYGYLSSDNQTPAKYDFQYEVKDDYGNDYGHRESRNGENTQGVYKVLLPDGRRQIVHYEADSHGYRPRITYEDTGTNFKASRESTTTNDHGYQY